MIKEKVKKILYNEKQKEKKKKIAFINERIDNIINSLKNDKIMLK